MMNRSFCLLLCLTSFACGDGKTIEIRVDQVDEENPFEASAWVVLRILDESGAELFGRELRERESFTVDEFVPPSNETLQVSLQGFAPSGTLAASGARQFRLEADEPCCVQICFCLEPPSDICVFCRDSSPDSCRCAPASD